MYPSSLRTTSLNANQLNAELARRGAKTFGSMERKQQRLQRFIDAEAKRAPVKETAPRKTAVVAPPQRQQQEEVRRSLRISALLREYLGY
jgi:hypothetical protein